jgi:hypothetical protein
MRRNTVTEGSPVAVRIDALQPPKAVACCARKALSHLRDSVEIYLAASVVFMKFLFRGPQIHLVFLWAAGAFVSKRSQLSGPPAGERGDGH